MTTEVVHHTHSESSVYRVLTVGGHTVKERLCFCETDEDHNGPVLTAAAKAEMIAKAMAAVGMDDGEPLTRQNIPPWYDEEVETAMSAALDSLAENPLAAIETWGRLRHLCNALGVKLKGSR